MSSARADLLQLVKLVAGDLVSGHGSPVMRSVGVILTQTPGATPLLLDLLLAETRKKRPNGSLIDAFLFMIGEALREARMAIEFNAHGPAAALVAEVRASLVAAAEAGRLAPDMLMAIAQLFVAAKLDPGDELRAVAFALTDEAASTQATESDIEDIAAQCEALSVAFGNDPFLIHSQLSEQFAIFPDEQKRLIVATLLVSDTPSMRDAAIGWLLDPSPGVSLHVAEGLASAAARGLVSGDSADRLVLMRPWAPEASQASIDLAVKACRQRGVMATAKPAAQVAAVFASGCDGAGAQTFLVLVKRGRKLALASLLVKHGFGVRDAMVSEGFGKREVDQLLAGIRQELDAFDASPEIVQAAIAHGLAVGLENGAPPPFGLAQYIEAVGLTQVRPERLDAAALIAELLDAAPAERRSAKAVEAALGASKRWPQDHVFPESWFEQDEAAHAAISARGGKKQRETRVMESLLPARRARWAELLAWTAKAAQDQVEGDAWIDFALVARELLGQRPLAEIPVAVWIARNTVAALTGR